MELAERAARAAGGVLLSYYGRPPQGVDSKSSETDLVSDADREAEQVIRELLETERPADGLIAEEGSRSESESGRRWLVDPLDGTINFLYGFPAWGVSIALEDEHGLALGVVLDPVRPELFAAVRGQGATLDGKPIRDEYLIVDSGKLAGAGAHSYTAGNATGGSEEAAQFGTS